jgi:hypothetical protein
MSDFSHPSRVVTNRRFFPLGTLLILTFCLGRPTHAQDSSRLEGTVTDSVHSRPLAGVRVVAVGAGSRTDVQRATTTDSAGRYRIDSLPAGRYSVGFESPLLDSLEVALTPREAVLPPGGAATVHLALPPAPKLRAAVCATAALPPGTGAIVGRVVSAATESPLPDVGIAMAWRELSFDKAKLRPTNEERTATVVTDSAGWYRLCGVPTGAWLSVQLHHEDLVGPLLRMRIDDTLGVAVRHLSFAMSSAREVGDTTPTGRPRSDAPLAGTARLSGVIVGPEGAPVAQAEVRVAGTIALGQTDVQGRYALAGLPAGTQMLSVRRVGYAVDETYVELRDGVTTTRDLKLRRIVSLDSIRVVAIRERYPEFAENRRFSSFGYFLDPQAIQRQRVSFTSDIIEKVPGFSIAGEGHNARVIDLRGAGSESCPVNIVVDETEGFRINDVHPSSIGAIEVYHVGGPAPVQFNRGCGVIMIWSKR